MSLLADQSLVCPNCGERIKLTESLAAPLVAATRAEYEKQLATQAEQFGAEKLALDIQRVENARRAAELEVAAKRQEQDVALAVQAQVEQQVAKDRKAIAEQELIRARQQVESELESERRSSRQQTERIKTLTEKLATAQTAEAALLKKKLELEDKERELELNLQQGIAAGLERARVQAFREAQTSYDLKMQDREMTITKLRDEIKGLQQKAEQGSQQAQGESLELVLEGQLRAEFPFDLIEPVPKGEFGGDIIQSVRDQSGQVCGKILWESKRTRNWSDSWLAKLRSDQRMAHADFAVIVSQTLPKDVEHFAEKDGIWVSSINCFVPLANALRMSIMELASVRRSSEDQETKAQQVYKYLTGPRFKHRVECIVEKFTELRQDLDGERKWMNKQWAKRDRELTSVLEATSGMYGDLQGIAGQSLQEIEALEGSALLELKS